MSIIGSLFNINNVVFNCFKSKSKSLRYFDEETEEISKKYKITLLEIKPAIKILNLFPESNHVNLWSSMIVGNNLTYILCNLKNDLINNVDDNNKVLNKNGDNILNNELNEFLNSIYRITIKDNKKLQFMMAYKNKLFFVFTFPIYGDEENKIIIGVNCFIRPFNGMNTEINTITPSVRFSSEF